MTTNGKFIASMLMLATLAATCVLLTNMMPRLVAPLDDECTRMTPWAEPSAIVTPTLVLLGLGAIGLTAAGLLYASARLLIAAALHAARALRRLSLPGANGLEAAVAWLNQPRPAA